MTTNILEHVMVPNHEVLSSQEKTVLFEKFKITKEQLPRMYSSDAVLKHIKAKVGDVVKIIRSSPTAGTTTYYRQVVG